MLDPARRNSTTRVPVVLARAFSLLGAAAAPGRFDVVQEVPPRVEGRGQRARGEAREDDRRASPRAPRARFVARASSSLGRSPRGFRGARRPGRRVLLRPRPRLPGFRPRFARLPPRAATRRLRGRRVRRRDPPRGAPAAARVARRIRHPVGGCSRARRDARNPALALPRRGRGRGRGRGRVDPQRRRPRAPPRAVPQGGDARRAPRVRARGDVGECGCASARRRGVRRRDRPSDAALEDQREKTRAAKAEAAAANARADALARERSAVSARLEAQSLSPAARCDALLKAGWLAHYWRLAYELGVAPERSWREADLWSRRAPEGGDEALRRVALAAAEEASASGPALAFLGSRGGGGGGGGGGGSGSDAAAFAPSHPAIPRPGAAGWDPTTAADAAEVETALRVAAQSRLEEAVLVALADRRRALASRLVGKAAEALTRGSIGSFGSGESRGSRRAAKTPNPDDAPNADGVDDETDDESDDLGDEHMGGERGAGWIRLSPAEEAEVRYRRDWLAYAWSRALASGGGGGDERVAAGAVGGARARGTGGVRVGERGARGGGGARGGEGPGRRGAGLEDGEGGGGSSARDDPPAFFMLISAQTDAGSFM